jgi:uncharacterized ion transporter superfamily protein YfcC
MKISKEMSITIVGLLISVLALIISLWAFFLAQKTDADISQIKNMTSDIKNDTSLIKKTITSMPIQYGIFFWVAIIVIVIFIVGFFIYMFYPSKLSADYHPEKRYIHPERKKKKRKKKQKY